MLDLILLLWRDHINRYGLKKKKRKHFIKNKTYFSGEEYVKSLTANPELIDRLACLSEEGVCLSLFYFVFEKWKY